MYKTIEINGEKYNLVPVEDAPTPYSTMYNITNPDLAGLLDYLEREMGWEITHRIYIKE